MYLPKGDKLYLLLEEDLDVFAKARRVVVADSLGVTKRLQQWVGLEDLFRGRAAT